jgi:hypothetical protein
MTTVLDSPVAAPAAPPHKRRIWLSVLVVLALVGAGIGWIVYINTYQPLSLTSGPYGTVTPKTMKTIGDGVTDTNLIVVGPAGTTATAIFPIANNGPRPVRLLGLGQGPSYIHESLTWSRLEPSSAQAPGLPGSAHAFPVTVQPGATVLILDTVTQPTCSTGANPGTSSILSIPLRWSALGVHHVWSLPLQSTTTLPITVCPSTAALAHIATP